MAQVWNSARGESYDVSLLADLTSGIVTPVVANPTGTVLGLDITSTASRTAGPLNGGVFHFSCSVWCFVKFGNGSVTADNTSMMLAPGERLFVVPNGVYVSVVSLGGANPDGLLRMTECV